MAQNSLTESTDFNATGTSQGGGDDDFEYESEEGRGDTPPGAGGQGSELDQTGNSGGLNESGVGNGDEDLGSSTEGGPGGEAPTVGRGYNKADYDHLSVGADIKELFEFIDLCKPSDIELESKFKPFIPDFIPAVGDIDLFLKPPRPDGEPDKLGITVLDEPGKQSDSTVLEMVLRLQSKKANLPSMEVRGIEHADKKPKEIMAWVDQINQLHQSSPSTTVNYSRPMPPIEHLMEEWPPEIEELLEKIRLPSADLDVDLKQFARIACAMLDIPVHGNLVESLHVFFTLYLAFKENQFFKARAGANSLGVTGGGLGASLGATVGSSSSSSSQPPR